MSLWTALTKGNLNPFYVLVFVINVVEIVNVAVFDVVVLIVFSLNLIVVTVTVARVVTFSFSLLSMWLS